MNNHAVKKWLADRFEEAIRPKPTSYPHNAVCGILYDAGFDNTQVKIKINRPAKPIPADKQAYIIINLPFKEEVQRTTGGAQGQIDAKADIQVDLVWIA